jgi:hypothetical protein
MLNEAYHTLKDPTLRVQYLLSLEGIPVGEHGKTVTDIDLLQEIMEIKESIGNPLLVLAPFLLLALVPDLLSLSFLFFLVLASCSPFLTFSFCLSLFLLDSILL